MTRVIPTATCALVIASGVLAAQGNRTREFGRAQEAWCREASGSDFCEVREATLPNLNTVSIDSRPNGAVHVRAWDRGDVRVRVRVTASAPTDAAARTLAADTRLVTEDGRIEMDGPELRNRRNTWWSASFEVEVPRRANVTVDVVNGGIVVEGLAGLLDARTTNGGLALTNVAGDIRGEAVNGGVTVDLNGRRWEGSGLDVRTVNGGVRLWLPADYSAELEARATNGGISVDFPVTLQGLRNPRRAVRATIGSGGAPLRLATNNGGVQINRK